MNMISYFLINDIYSNKQQAAASNSRRTRSGFQFSQIRTVVLRHGRSRSRSQYVLYGVRSQHFGTSEGVAVSLSDLR